MWFICVVYLILQSTCSIQILQIVSTNPLQKRYILIKYARHLFIGVIINDEDYIIISPSCLVKLLVTTPIYRLQPYKNKIALDN